MSFIQQLQAISARLVNGFFWGLAFAFAVFFGLQFDQLYEKEVFEGLPIIQELTDAYKEGWATIYELSNAGLSESSSFMSPRRQQKIVASSLWDKRAVTAKLKERGFSKGKLKSAKRYLDYIDKHKDIAMRDMNESGVFASIKLAQGLLESAAGQSKLAKATNNHFGIKARANSVGRQKLRSKQFDRLTDYDFTPSHPAIGVYRMTDDHHYDRFEKYVSVGDSYWRHTQLVTRNCTLGKVGCYSWIWKTFPVGESTCNISSAAQSFYGFSKLSADYFFDGQVDLPYFAAAAAGLKMAGYATSKTYHKKLSYIITTYELWRFDMEVKYFREN